MMLERTCRQSETSNFAAGNTVSPYTRTHTCMQTPAMPTLPAPMNSHDLYLWHPSLRTPHEESQPTTQPTISLTLLSHSLTVAARSSAQLPLMTHVHRREHSKGRILSSSHTPSYVPRGLAHQALHTCKIKADPPQQSGFHVSLA